MKPLGECQLYTFVDTAYLNGRKVEEVAWQLCDGGSDLIQLRAKGSSADDIRRMAEAIMIITERAGVRLVINDHPEVARALGAPVCHLGQEDFFGTGYTAVDQVVGHPPAFQVGLSTHSPAQALRAIAAKPAYLAIGPVYATATKAAAKPVTLDYVHWAVTHVPIPWFAIGGLTMRNLDEVLAAGARRICVVSAILTAPDISQACQSFKERLISAPL